MKCYECALEGKDTDAVGICIVCGRGVCKEHLIHEETPVWEGNYPIQLKPDQEHIKRIVCVPCHIALKENCLFNEVC
ncbi:DUF2180 family protein [Methanosarcina mazei]|uniref:DUF2180 family protein n=4 Tax=Methanosarcina mazei TaxID=2209 RepID=A0A0F8M8Z5_METMZ|nr:DUF2180 family protein [Methanosarcina mazei]AAM30325.1 Zinc finger protein [Methanosarcina mazei Go1]AKB39674.1 hypothetical protein MSMAW_0683 [Methanosarcina mazei WWM610]AKB63876.1 hypothetical protein MSMAS_0680 [Methanosarcina mazei S-6]KKG05852.1 hypothetical protein DU31_17230 [Methanosarcina mazei]KKG56114.1 hypothetical protein DU33_13980 [Methanosarcina mazei]